MRSTRIALATLLVITALASGCGVMLHRNVQPPAASEFGNGPRTSAHALYSATLQQAGTLKPRKMYTVRVAVVDAAGTPVHNATIAVDGGMPQHGHGLPTQPRVTRNLGGGVYEISGLRFNMGGWWELKLAIATPAGNDNVTFNLSL